MTISRTCLPIISCSTMVWVLMLSFSDSDDDDDDDDDRWQLLSGIVALAYGWMKAITALSFSGPGAGGVIRIRLASL